MTNSEIPHLARRIARGDDTDYQAYFRRRGLELRDALQSGHFDVNFATQPPSELVPAKVRVDALELANHLRSSWKELFSCQDSAAALWALYLARGENQGSSLCELLPSLEAIRPVYRNGLNIYKLNGWVVHVLVGYSFVTHHIPNGTLPDTVDWDEGVRTFQARLQVVYSGLSSSTKTLLAVAFLGHDIGVRVEIRNHDLHGVPLVPAYLSELGMDDRTKPVAVPDLEWRVTCLVRFHALMNRVGVELRDAKVGRQLFDFLKSDGKLETDRRAFVVDELPSLLTLLGTADLVAVNDELLTTQKASKIMAGFSRLETIVQSLGESADGAVDEAEGLERIVNFLPDPGGVQDEGDVEQLLASGTNASDFLRSFAALGEIDFGQSLLPRLRNNEQVVRLFAALLPGLFNATNGDLLTGVMRFSPALQADTVSKWLDRCRTGELPKELEYPITKERGETVLTIGSRTELGVSRH